MNIQTETYTMRPASQTEAGLFYAQSSEQEHEMNERVVDPVLEAYQGPTMQMGGM